MELEHNGILKVGLMELEHNTSILKVGT